MPSLDLDTLRQFRNVTVMGIGRFGGGAGAARFFAELGAHVLATDLAPAERLLPSLESLEGLGITFVLGEHRNKDFILTDLVVANQAARPDNPLLEQARANRVPVATETGLALALCRSPWLGVTGSSGKSTTASLLAACLRESDPGVMLGGNIGGDLLTRIAAQRPESAVVAELSSFQLSYLASDFAAGRIAPPRVAVLTNLAPNHLDWHRDMDEYLAVKRALLLAQSKDDWAVVNNDDYRLAGWAVTAPARTVRCALEDPGFDDACYLQENDVVLRLDGGEVFRWSLDEYRLPGRHNRYNALSAAAAAYVYNNDGEAIRRALAAFSGLPHRLRQVFEIDGRVFVDDSKSTTPEATITALTSFDKPIVLIAGGYDKFAPFEELAEAIQRYAHGIVLIGQSAGRLAGSLREAAAKRPETQDVLPIVEAGEDFLLAMREAFRLTPEGGVVLLSPACASYGMFINYEERGAMFAKAARDLAKGT